VQLTQFLQSNLLKKILFILLFGILGGAAGFGVAVDWSILFFILGGVFAGFAFLSPRFGFYLILLLIVIGQLGRVPLDVGGRDEVLFLDLLIPIVVLGWVFHKVYHKERFKKTSLDKILILFVGWMVLGLIFALRSLDLPLVLKSGLYLIRWVEYLLLFFLALDLMRTKELVIHYLKVIIGMGTLLAILGFLQLVFVPNFGFMQEAGWDPHRGRLLSTWFDPNFIGGFFALCFSLVLGLYYYLRKDQQARLALILAGIIFAVATILTYSRSAYLVFLLVLLIWGVVYARKLLVICLVAFTLVTIFVPRLQERVGGAVSLDVTAKSRLHSWDRAFQIVKTSPIVGVGYNTYRYTQEKLGFIEKKDKVIRSTTGADSSLLTILATTGIVGLLFYLYLYFVILKKNFRLIVKNQLETQKKLSFAIFVSFLGLLAHSFFVNDLLYPYLMIIFWILVAMVFRASKLFGKA